MAMFEAYDGVQWLLRLLWVGVAVAGGVFCLLHLKLSRWVTLLLLGFAGEGLTALGSFLFLIGLNFAGGGSGAMRLFFLGVGVLNLMSHVLVVVGLALVFNDLSKRREPSGVELDWEQPQSWEPPGEGNQGIRR